MSNVSLVDGHIDEPKMTDGQIIKALECCVDHKYLCRRDCPVYDYENEHHSCDMYIMTKALDLINRQKTRIERLEKENKSFSCIGKLYSEIKSEARKEFVERLKEKKQDALILLEGYHGDVIAIEDVDNLLKEMDGEQMPGKARKSLRAKTIQNVLRSNLSETDKKCIIEIFERYEQREKMKKLRL